jgi:hypothetical protein
MQSRQRTIAAAQAVVARTRAGRLHQQHEDFTDYVWGSNGVAAGYGMYLLIANQFAPNRDYVDTAARQSALPAWAQYLLALLGDATGRESIHASAPSAERVKPSAGAVAWVDVRWA